MDIFSKRLRDLRINKKAQQADMAKVLDVSPQSYSAYENGREPNYDLLVKLSQYFNVTTDYLIGLTDIKTHDADIQAIHEKTGLLENAIGWLEDAKLRKDELVAHGIDSIEWIDLINVLICNEEFRALVIEMVQILSNRQLENGEGRLGEDFALFMLGQRMKKILDSLEGDFNVKT